MVPAVPKEIRGAADPVTTEKGKPVGITARDCPPGTSSS